MTTLREILMSNDLGGIRRMWLSGTCLRQVEAKAKKQGWSSQATGALWCRAFESLCLSPEAVENAWFDVARRYRDGNENVECKRSFGETGVLPELPKDLEKRIKYLPKQFETCFEACGRLYAKKLNGKWGGSESFRGMELGLLRDLYSVPRTGWTRVIPAFGEGKVTRDGVENVAEHSLKTMLLSVGLSGRLDWELCMMAICHDAAEVVVGDLTPQEAPDREAKHRIEAECFEKLLKDVSLSDEKRERILGLFMQYLREDGVNAAYVHLADKLDMALQAIVYESLFGVCLDEFLVSATTDIVRSSRNI